MLTCKCCITKHLKVIRNAWHSHYALSLVFKVVLVGFSLTSFTL
nr:DUF3265 domain-containing protein [Vibrio owensii]